MDDAKAEIKKVWNWVGLSRYRRGMKMPLKAAMRKKVIAGLMVCSE